MSQGHGEDEPSVREMGRVSFTNFCEGMMFVDPWTGEYRSPTKKDVGTVARLVDAMDDVDDYYAGIGALDQHPMTYPIHGVHAAFLNSRRTGRLRGAQRLGGAEDLGAGRHPHGRRRGQGARTDARTSAPARSAR